MKRYESPNIEINNVEIGPLLSTSETEPGATSIGSPNVEDDIKGCSVWEDVEQYNTNNYEEYE